MTARKPSFYVRISSLIIVQVVFVFAAVVLVVFYSDDQATAPGRLVEVQESVAETCRSVEVILTDSASEPSEPLTGDPLARIADLIRSNQSVLAAGLFQADGTHRPGQILFDRGDQAQKLFAGIADSPIKSAEHDLLSYALNHPTGSVTSTLWGGGSLVTYYSLGQPQKHPAVLVVLAEHGMLVTSRSNLSYVVFLLFLVSTLVSLLTIYLISLRVRRPMVRLLRGLEKTASGEAYHIIEEEKDDELNSLVASFNKMSRTLMSNHGKLREYSTRATEMNISLMRTHLFLATMINSSPYPVIATTRSGVMVLVNETAAKEFGFNEEEMLGQSLPDLLALPADSSDDNLHEDSCGSEFEARCRRKDGTSFPAYIIASPIGLGEKNAEAWLYILRDISESQAFQDMMIRLDRYSTRGEMAGDIAHDINNFLAVLGGNLELLPIILRKNDPEKIEKKLAVMRETVSKIEQFTNGLMDTPQDHATLRPSDLNQLLENVLAFIKSQKRLRGIHFDMDLSGDLPLVPLDQAMTEQLITNLIFNAGDALAGLEGDRRIGLTTSMMTHDGHKYARIEVKDTGRGIGDEYKELLFQKRFTTRRKGHGIGLVSCRKIVEAHRGRVGYHFDDGAVFQCDLPIERVPQSEDLVEQAQGTIGV